jgi:hypothetical protein
LIDRTRERKLTWKACPSAEPDEEPRFSAQLDLSQEAVIGQFEDDFENGFWGFSLIEHDHRWTENSIMTAISGHVPPLIPDRIVLQVSIEKDPPYGYDTQEESDLAKLLVNLYELARRSAYQIDASVGRAISYLDKLAV